MKLWVVGAGGMLGSCLLERCRAQRIEAVGSTRQEGNITDVAQLRRTCEGIQPTHIVNCAAYTDVDGAQRDPGAAFAVNRDGAGHVAKVARECGAKLVHVSTDYVFDGKGSEPYREEDLCAPANAYGQSKWEGEKKVLEILPKACVMRTSWLFGRGGKNFISSLLKGFQQKEELQVVFDQCGKPTYCRDAADAVLALLNSEGIVHFANAGERSRYQIALDMLQAARDLGIEVKCQRILPVPSAQFPTPAPRPAYSVLDTTRYHHLTLNKPRPWGEAVKEFIHEATSL